MQSVPGVDTGLDAAAVVVLDIVVAAADAADAAAVLGTVAAAADVVVVLGTVAAVVDMLDGRVVAAADGVYCSYCYIVAHNQALAAVVAAA